VPDASSTVPEGASNTEQAKRKAGGMLNGEKRRLIWAKECSRYGRTVVEYWSTNICPSGAKAWRAAARIPCRMFAGREVKGRLETMMSAFAPSRYSSTFSAGVDGGGQVRIDLEGQKDSLRVEALHDLLGVNAGADPELDNGAGLGQIPHVQKVSYRPTRGRPDRADSSRV
jgi:hypothetical protein